jgi:2-polyprenyl-3-methyl-5-hydroxy-6-metoxy-1,4-benzoquinol methylase
MIDFQRRVKMLKYLLGIYPSIWQLPNAVKIHEFMELTNGLSTGSNNRILDLGCGQGMQTQLIAKTGAYLIGVEPNAKRYGLALRELQSSRVKPRVKFFNGTLEEAGLEEESFDSVISFCVLEHIPNLDDVLKNIYKILKQGGEIHATVDSLSNIDNESLLNKHRREHAVVQYFSLDTIEHVLNQAGFVVTENRHILTSELARNKLIKELETGNYLEHIGMRKTAVQELIHEESQSNTNDQGTMILVRARKV